MISSLVFFIFYILFTPKRAKGSRQDVTKPVNLHPHILAKDKKILLPKKKGRQVGSKKMLHYKIVNARKRQRKRT